MYVCMYVRLCACIHMAVSWVTDETHTFSKEFASCNSMKRTTNFGRILSSINQLNDRGFENLTLADIQKVHVRIELYYIHV